MLRKGVLFLSFRKMFFVAVFFLVLALGLGMIIIIKDAELTAIKAELNNANARLDEFSHKDELDAALTVPAGTPRELIVGVEPRVATNGSWLLTPAYSSKLKEYDSWSTLWKVTQNSEQLKELLKTSGSSSLKIHIVGMADANASVQYSDTVPQGIMILLIHQDKNYLQEISKEVFANNLIIIRY